MTAQALYEELELELLHILTEEYAHADLLEQAIKDLGGDPTMLTPSANLAANVSRGLPEVLADPRVNLLQSLEAIVVAELANNECWMALDQLALQGGHETLADQCLEAIAHEREHFRDVRRWLAAGQGRPAIDEDEEMAEDDEMAEDVAEGAEFTFTASSAVDDEGFAVSEEESASGKADGSPTRRTRPARARKSR